MSHESWWNLFWLFSYACIQNECDWISFSSFSYELIWLICLLGHLLLFYLYLRVEQVQEKKVKKISDMNIDPSKAMENGSIASSSNSNNSRPHLANGGSSDRSYSYLSNDFSFPPGGIPSLRLPSVVVLRPSSWIVFLQIFVSRE